jgi:hypothetical protein
MKECKTVLLQEFAFLRSLTAETGLMIPLKNGNVITLQDLATMKAADYAKLTGNKMTFFDRVGFKIAQKKLRNNINADGTLSKKWISNSGSSTANQVFTLVALP